MVKGNFVIRTAYEYVTKIFLFAQERVVSFFVASLKVTAKVGAPSIFNMKPNQGFPPCFLASTPSLVDSDLSAPYITSSPSSSTKVKAVSRLLRKITASPGQSNL